MKRYNKAVLSMMVLGAMPLMAAQDKNIHVTTFVDEDGTNLAACSLREAITTASLNKAYGGCSAGNTNSTSTDVIQLEAGTYTLNREIIPQSSVNIFGKSPVSYESKDPVTNSFPARTELTTTIQASSSRFFNTTSTGAGIVLNNLKLIGGSAPTARGGALYLGGAATLNRVTLTGANALNGGAIFLEQSAQDLSVNNSIFDANTATSGSSVLAMSCQDNLVYTARSIKFTNSSLIRNNSPAASNMIELCGKPTASFISNTIAQNTVNTSSGSILKFTTDSASINELGKLSASSSLELTNNTIVENTAFSTFLYDSVGTKALKFNVLAFNSNNSCRYLPGNISTASKTGVGLLVNALNLKGTNSVCEIANDVLLNTNGTATNHNTLDVLNAPRSQYLTDLQAATQFTAFLPLYYPINNDNNASPSVDLVDSKRSECNTTDQRSLARNADSVEIIDTSPRNSCDIGSVELSRLTAENIEDLTNKDMVALVDGYQVQLDLNKTLLDDPDTDPEFLPFYRSKITEFTELLSGTKANTHYRPVYIDPFAESLPAEILQNGTYAIKPLNKTDYIVETSAKGAGTTFATAIPLTAPSVLSCVWDPNLQFIVMYKNTDAVAQAGDAFFCSYTLKLRSDPTVQSTGIIKASFNNIAPIAKADEYALRYGSDQVLNVNLLDNDSDLGDGPTTELINYPTAPKAKFYRNANGVELPIRIDSIPNGITITPERSGPCPGVDSAKTCFGGNLNIQVKNNFNPFNFSFNYVIYDAEGLVSNQATVTLVNTANNIDSSKGGGGAIGVWAMLSLASLMMLRRRSRN